MNMGTAMKAVGTGWKQSGTTDNGKGRDAGKADFADTFSEMLKAGKKGVRVEKADTEYAEGSGGAEDHRCAEGSQTRRRSTDAQADQKAADTGKDAVQAETAGQDNTAVKKNAGKRSRSRKKPMTEPCRMKQRQRQPLWKEWQSSRQLWRKTRSKQWSMAWKQKLADCWR